MRMKKVIVSLIGCLFAVTMSLGAAGTASAAPASPAEHGVAAKKLPRCKGHWHPGAKKCTVGKFGTNHWPKSLKTCKKLGRKYVYGVRKKVIHGRHIGWYWYQCPRGKGAASDHYHLVLYGWVYLD